MSHPHGPPWSPRDDAHAHALLVGVDAYPELPAGSDLGAGVDNALAWRALATRLGVPDAHQHLLLSRAGAQPPVASAPATAPALRQAVEGLASRLTAAPGQRGLLYFSGHGESDSSDLRLLASDDASGRGLGLRQLVSILQRADAQATGPWSLTVVLECCHAGTATTTDLSRVTAPLQALRHGQVVLLTAGDEAVREAYLATGWAGLFTWAATALLSSWAHRSTEGRAYVALSYRSLAAQAQGLMATLGSTQRVAVWPQPLADHAFFQPLHAPPAPVEAQARPMTRAAQLSGGVNGFMIYELLVSGVRQGLVYSTSSSSVPSPLDKEHEYWDVDLAALSGNDFTMKVIAVGQTTSPAPTSIGTKWSTDNAATVTTSPFNGTVSGGATTWRCTSNASTLPWLRLKTSAPKRTYCVRASATKVFHGASVGDTLDFEQVSTNLDATGLDAYLSRDDWAAW